MKELIIAIGLLLFIEGMLYASFPSKMKNMLKIIEKLPISQLRTSGLLFALIVGVVVGTYSSVFVATPIMHDTLGKFNK